jgi:hypothetical protein
VSKLVRVHVNIGFEAWELPEDATPDETGAYDWTKHQVKSVANYVCNVDIGEQVGFRDGVKWAVEKLLSEMGAVSDEAAQKLLKNYQQ